MTSLVWSDGIRAAADALAERVRAELASAGITGEVVVTGPASLDGVLTRGDLDLHLRVTPTDFDGVVRRLRELRPPASEHAWAPTLAVFDLTEDRPAGLAVTPVGSQHDRRFARAWQRLADDPDLLEQYNALKRSFVDDERYEAEKAAFFDLLAD